MADVPLELAAALLALAGARSGDRVWEAGAGARVRRGLLAAAGATGCAADDVAVAVVGSAEHLPGAARRLRPGGRLVAVAPDGPSAARSARAAGVAAPHLVPTAAGVAWSGRPDHTAATRAAP